MGGAVSAGQDHDDLIDKLKTACYVKTTRIENVYRAVDRAFYFLPECKDSAYKDLAWKKGNIHLSAPCIYAEVLESLLLEPGLSFLNIGSGTGYLNTMVGLVLGPYGVNHGIELFKDVVEYARSRLDEFKRSAPALDCYEFCEPLFVTGNGLLLGSEVRQYDRVYCGAACPENHENYMKNLLKVGGVLVVPLNDKLMQITRKNETEWESRSVLSVSFSTLQLPQQNDPLAEKTVTLPDINPLTLQEICRSVIRTLLRKEAQEEFPNIAIRRRKFYSRSKRRRILPNLIIPILDSSDDEGELGRNNIFVPAGLRNIGCVIDISPTIGGRGYRAMHAVAPRLREGDDGFAVGEAAEIADPAVNMIPGNGESSSSGASSQNTHQEEQENEDEMDDTAGSQEDESEDDEPDRDSSSDRRRSRAPKRDKLDSGVGPDLEPDSTPPLLHPPGSFMVSDDSSNDSSSTRRRSRAPKRDSGVGPDLDLNPDSSPPGSFGRIVSDDSSDGEGKMDVESEDSEAPSSLRKSPHPDDTSAVPLYGEVMRDKINALSLPPTLKAFLNYDRPAVQL